MTGPLACGLEQKMDHVPEVRAKSAGQKCDDWPQNPYLKIALSDTTSQYDSLHLFLHARSPREGGNAINRTVQCEVVSLRAIFRYGFWIESSE